MENAMDSSDPHFQQVIANSFREAAFVADLGISLVDCGPGWCISLLPLAPRHLQHTGIVHAGVQTTLADHTAGAAAMTLTPATAFILTVEFKMNLLRPGKGETLWCKAQVLKPGRGFHVVESEVYALDGGKKTLISKLCGTMAVLPRA
jgi:uncharacterized protein (TIGR00369 family)